MVDPGRRAAVVGCLFPFLSIDVVTQALIRPHHQGLIYTSPLIVGSRSSSSSSSPQASLIHPSYPLEEKNKVTMSAPNTDSGAGATAKKHQYDPDFTASVIAATGPKATPRMRQVMGSLIQHVHDFARENDITVAEWMNAVEFLNRAGQMSNDRRNETQLVSDVIGLESLVDEITSKLLVGADYESTKTAILGPFFRKDTPPTPNDASIIKTMPADGEVTYMHGIVTDATTGKPLEGVQVDIWQCSTNGLYEQQDPDQADFNLRGKFTTDKNGYYGLYCIRPVPYPVPYDGELNRKIPRGDSA